MPGTNTCMLIYKFTNNLYSDIYNTIVAPLIETHTGLKCVDGLSHFDTLTIKMDVITRLIEEARLIVVDISYENANVFFELGIAYAHKKQILFLCHREKYTGYWSDKIPFDISGKDLLIFKDKNELRLLLGRYISDCLYKTKYKPEISWIPTHPDNCMKSASELDFTKLFNAEERTKGEVSEFWSTIPVNNNFTIEYTVHIQDQLSQRNPDLRLLFSPNRIGYPRIAIIFPWENSKKHEEKLECHITYYKEKESTNYDADRLQSPAVCTKKIENSFKVFVSFYYPNLVVESALFDEVDRVFVSLIQLKELPYPIHFSQYIGFASHDKISISEISIKEIFL